MSHGHNEAVTGCAKSLPESIRKSCRAVYFLPIFTSLFICHSLQSNVPSAAAKIAHRWCVISPRRSAKGENGRKTNRLWSEAVRSYLKWMHKTVIENLGMIESETLRGASQASVGFDDCDVLPMMENAKLLSRRIPYKEIIFINLFVSCYQ